MAVGKYLLHLLLSQALQRAALGPQVAAKAAEAISMRAVHTGGGSLR